MRKIVIAIDGYSSSGKSTMARALAKRIGYVYVDSGAMYRAVTLYALRHNLISPNGELNVEGLEAALPHIKITFEAGNNGASHTYLNGEDVEKEIRSPEVAAMVSPVAAVGAVRHFLTLQQQALGKANGIVMDGRDIGTTVFPDAEMKVFVTASAEERARRRTEELKAKGFEANYDDVLLNIQERDHIDTTRKESPLRQAKDAHVLCNDHLSIAEQEEWLMDLYNKIIADVGNS